MTKVNLNKITIIDKVLAATFLKLVPKGVTPNQMTVFRFMTVPFIIFFLMLENYAVTISLFIISAGSDALDGAKARTADMVTEWGKMFDPVADKMLIGSVAAILISREINEWLAFIIIGIEVLLVIMALYRKKKTDVQIEAQKAGKVKMILQSFGVGFLMLFLMFPIPIFFTIAVTMIYLSVFFAILALFVYNSI